MNVHLQWGHLKKVIALVVLHLHDVVNRINAGVLAALDDLKQI